MNKVCTKCKASKELSKFYKAKKSKDGLRGTCKACAKDYGNKYRKVNKKKIVNDAKDYRQNNKEDLAIYHKKYQQTNKEELVNYRKKYYQNNPDKYNAHCAKRKAAKSQRTVAWADTDKILEFYTEAQQLTKETGIEHHVDHIIPLQGKNVSGLHVENNLQVITASENCSKGNKFIV